MSEFAAFIAKLYALCLILFSSTHPISVMGLFPLQTQAGLSPIIINIFSPLLLVPDVSDLHLQQVTIWCIKKERKKE